MLHRRLEASKVSVQKVLGMLHALANAESSYAHALQQVSNIDLVGEGDGPSLRRLVRSFAALPASVGAMHAHVRPSLPALLLHPFRRSSVLGLFSRFRRHGRTLESSIRSLMASGLLLGLSVLQ